MQLIKVKIQQLVYLPPRICIKKRQKERSILFGVIASPNVWHTLHLCIVVTPCSQTVLLYKANNTLGSEQSKEKTFFKSLISQASRQLRFFLG